MIELDQRALGDSRILPPRSAPGGGGMGASAGLGRGRGRDACLKYGYGVATGKFHAIDFITDQIIPCLSLMTRMSFSISWPSRS